MTRSVQVAIVGATGLVGFKFLEILEQRDFPVEELRLFASSRSAGKTVAFRGKDHTVLPITPGCFKGVDIALFSAGGTPSKIIVPQAVSEGAVVIDNSSAWRQVDDVPLVVPEVNADDLNWHQGVIANPNCSTIPMVQALAPLHRVNPIKRIIVATYQSVSGAGLAPLQEYCQETYQWVADSNRISGFASGERSAPELVPEHFRTTYQPQSFPEQIVGNVLPQIGDITSNGYTSEEMKMLNESQKILHAPDLLVSATAVRVPVAYSHALAVTVECTLPIDISEAESLISQAGNVEIATNKQGETGNFPHPTPLVAAGSDKTLVGRIRKDLVFSNGLSLWIVSDNIRKGAALNAIQIAEQLLK